MFNLTILEVTIGLVFIYLLLSLVCTAVNEVIANVLSLRATNLEKWMQTVLGDALKGKLYEHPLINTLRGKKPPSYIPSNLFVLALLDVTTPSDVMPSEGAMNEIKEALKTPDTDASAQNVKKLLLYLIEEAGGNFQKARENTEKWFNDAMDRVNGWYKRKMQWITLGVALVVSIGLNADTLTIADRLWNNAPLRSAVVAAAEEAAKKKAETPPAQDAATPSDEMAKIGQIKKQLEELHVPIGWYDDLIPPSNETGKWVSKMIGWLFTAFAISLGAPFWFNMLDNLIKLRSSGKLPATGAVPGSEQSQEGQETKK